MARLAVPGPSFVREETVILRGPMGEPGARLRAGMSRPSETEDGWWLAHLWLADDEGVVPAIEVAPAAGPPPGAPLDVLGPRMSGALQGLIAEAGGRQMLRLRMPEAQDESRPWARPLVCMLAVRFDPVRAAVLRPNELARELLRGFAAACEGVGRPA
ncbi:MAG TPA: hypothetical protein VNT28_07615 [Candidatus Limnocylindrales bacterium]|jgi:hypothetical protein|nr:hypothetical protein [Candidatus Limnocylindrales bacterium]